MGRYYSVTVLPKATKGNLQPAPLRTWTSAPSGVFDPGALQVEFDVLTYAAAQPQGGSQIKIHNIPLSDLLQAQQFTGLAITVRGGMTAGLPLATASQAGVILVGQIYQSFGNWQSTEQNITFVINPALYSYTQPGNFVFQWKKGQTLAAAITQTLATVYPDLNVIINLGSSYAVDYVSSHVCQTLGQFGAFLQKLTSTPTRAGIDIFLQANNTLLIMDGLALDQKTVNLNFNDLVGQPTWINSGIVLFSTIMRADIVPGTSVIMPPGLQSLPGIVGVQAASLPSGLKQKTSFQGKFIVQSARHIGNFRDPNGTSWVTVFQAAVKNV